MQIHRRMVRCLRPTKTARSRRSIATNRAADQARALPDRDKRLQAPRRHHNPVRGARRVCPVIGGSMLRHRHIEFIRFLNAAEQVCAGKSLHPILKPATPISRAALRRLLHRHNAGPRSPARGVSLSRAVDHGADALDMLVRRRRDSRPVLTPDAQASQRAKSRAPAIFATRRLSSHYPRRHPPAGSCWLQPRAHRRPSECPADIIGAARPCSCLNSSSIRAALGPA